MCIFKLILLTILRSIKIHQACFYRALVPYSSPSTHPSSSFSRRAAQSLPPRPGRHNNVVPAHITNTPPQRNASRESPRVSAVTDDDFPRVLNGPAPGYAGVALRALLFGAQPVGDDDNIVRSDTTATVSEGALANGAAIRGARAKGETDGVDPFLESRRTLGGAPFQHQQQQEQGVNLRVNGRLSFLEDIAQPPQQPPSRAFSSELAYEEEVEVEEEELSRENREVLGEGDKRAEKAQIPYNDLLAMQVEREVQSHQEACDKYSKVGGKKKSRFK